MNNLTYLGSEGASVKSNYNPVPTKIPFSKAPICANIILTQRTSKMGHKNPHVEGCHTGKAIMRVEQDF